jgi:hypothetical protein
LRTIANKILRKTRYTFHIDSKQLQPMDPFDHRMVHWKMVALLLSFFGSARSSVRYHRPAVSISIP